MKNIIIFLFLVSLCVSCSNNTIKEKKPKLVIGIVVDQMRYDYLTRFKDRYSENGFKRIINNGFLLENAHYNYRPTYTAPGHASIFTGTTPANHGIIANHWYDKYAEKTIYCVDDGNYETIGNNGVQGKKSPKRMHTTTVTDQLRIAQNFKGKTIGIAIKDRSSILPAGHTANAAYWFDGGKFGGFISSSYYMEDLPKWVKDFNNSDKLKPFVNEKWETLYPIETYKNSRADNNNFERSFNGEKAPIFPKDIPSLKDKNGFYSILKNTPAGNTFTVNFAKAAITNEKLGQRDATDFLTLSFSSTDYIGHQFGPYSIEIEDTYLRLDKDLSDFFTFLDNQVGKDNYTLFLTADHGVVANPDYLRSIKVPAHFLNLDQVKTSINEVTKKYFKSENFIKNFSNLQVFLDEELIEAKGYTKKEVADKIVEDIAKYDGIYKAVSAETLQKTEFTSGILATLQKGYNQKYSGDVLLVPYPASLGMPQKGTSHGSGNSYDTHVPIIFYGNGIKKGTSAKRFEIVDIAPTISNLLDIEFPNGFTGKIVDEALKK